MFLLALHVVAIGILVASVWAIAYRQGERAAERRARRQLGQQQAAQPSTQSPTEPTAHA